MSSRRAARRDPGKLKRSTRAESNRGGVVRRPPVTRLPRPERGDASQLPPMLRLLIGGACAVVVVGGMRIAAPLLVPFMLTTMVVLATTPTVIRLQQRGIPPRLAVVGLYAVLVVVGLLLLIYLGLLLREFGHNLPTYSEDLDTRIAEAETTLQEFGAPIPGGQFSGGVITGFAAALADQLIDSVKIAVFVFPAAMLILLDSPRIMARIPQRLGADTRIAAAFVQFRASIVGFILVSTRTGLVLGVGVWLLLTLLDVEFPVFLGLLTFVANYIPSLGLLLAAVPAVAMAWVQHG